MNRFVAPLASGAIALSLLFGGCSERIGSPAPTASGPTESASTGQATQQATAQPTPVRTTVSTTTELSTGDLVKLADPSIVRIRSGGGTGTGFIVSEDGDVITNNHVVSGSANVSVTLSDGAVVTGRVIGTDPRADIAVVKLEGSGFTPLRLGKLADVFVGQDVVAIGYALDLKGGEGPAYTVTRGIVSAKNRAITESSPIAGAIQHDAAINHGNSGGPLLNLAGEVIGVNTAIAGDPNNPGATAPGIGFAVGIDTAKAVYEEIKATGQVRRGFLGVTAFEALRPAKARDLGLPADTGGVVLADAQSVVVNGPAAAAGIRSGDVILRINGVVLRTESDLSAQMIREDPGQTVDVELFRDGKKLTVQVTLGTPPAQ